MGKNQPTPKNNSTKVEPPTGPDFVESLGQSPTVIGKATQPPASPPPSSDRGL